MTIDQEFNDRLNAIDKKIDAIFERIHQQNLKTLTMLEENAEQLELNGISFSETYKALVAHIHNNSRHIGDMQ